MLACTWSKTIKYICELLEFMNSLLPPYMQLKYLSEKNNS